MNNNKPTLKELAKEHSRIDEFMAKIEDGIDQLSLAHYLALVAGVCQAKADHIRENWGDHESAAHWDKCCERIMLVVNLTNV